MIEKQAFCSITDARCERFTTLMEVRIMSAPRIPASEQYRLVMECRQSGLSDHQWCLEHGIKPGTFYNWIKRLKQKGVTEIPAPAGRDGYQPSPKQEVVRIDFKQEPVIYSDFPDREVQSPAAVHSEKLHPTMELSLDGAFVRITNDVDPNLLLRTLRILKGFSC